jgi:cell division protein FtsB
MKTTSKQIEIELNQTTKRLDELTEMRDDINAHLKTLQQGFIEGSRKDFETLDILERLEKIEDEHQKQIEETCKSSNLLLNGT